MKDGRVCAWMMVLYQKVDGVLYGVEYGDGLVNREWWWWRRRRREEERGGRRRSGGWWWGGREKRGGEWGGLGWNYIVVAISQPVMCSIPISYLSSVKFLVRVVHTREKIMWYFQCNIGMNGKKIIRWVKRWFLSPWKWGSFHRKYCPSGLWLGVLAMESNLLWQSLLVLVGVGMELNQWKGSPVVNIGKWQSLLISISHIFPFFSCFSVLEGVQWRECLVLRGFLWVTLLLGCFFFHLYLFVWSHDE